MGFSSFGLLALLDSTQTQLAHYQYMYYFVIESVYISPPYPTASLSNRAYALPGIPFISPPPTFTKPTKQKKKNYNSSIPPLSKRERHRTTQTDININTHKKHYYSWLVQQQDPLFLSTSQPLSLRPHLQNPNPISFSPPPLHLSLKLKRGADRKSVV